MAHYRNHPGDMGRDMSENITRTSRPVYLEDVVATGNRAQRRWAARKLAATNPHKAAANKTPAETPNADSLSAPTATALPSNSHTKEN